MRKDCAKNFSSTRPASYWLGHHILVCEYLVVLFCIPHRASVTLGKSHFLGKFLKAEETIYGGQKFESISIFSTVPSRDYLEWSASNDRLVIEDRTPAEAFEELVAQDLDEYPRRLFIFEDYLTGKKSADSKLVEYWTAGSNHFNLSICCTSQVLYSPNQDLRNIAQQSTVLGLWPSFRDRGQLKTLSRQVFPQAPLTFIDDCLTWANKQSGSYKNPLFIQLSNYFFSDRLRVASGLLPSENLIVYRPTRRR